MVISHQQDNFLTKPRPWLGWFVQAAFLIITLVVAVYVGAAMDSGMFPPKPPAKYVAPCEVLIVFAICKLVKYTITRSRKNI